jgi:hypothetical protein
VSDAGVCCCCLLGYCYVWVRDGRCNYHHLSRVCLSLESLSAVPAE